MNFHKKCEPFVVIKKSMGVILGQMKLAEQGYMLEFLKNLKLHEISFNIVYGSISIKIY